MEVTAEEFNGEKRLEIIKELTIKLQAEIYNNGFLIDELTKGKAKFDRFVEDLTKEICNALSLPTTTTTQTNTLDWVLDKIDELSSKQEKIE
jgi:hypothetical protein